MISNLFNIFQFNYDKVKLSAENVFITSVLFAIFIIFHFMDINLPFIQLIFSLSILLVLPAWANFYKIQKSTAGILGVLGLWIGVFGLLITFTGFFIFEFMSTSDLIYKNLQFSRIIVTFGKFGFVIVFPLGVLILGIVSLRSVILTPVSKTLTILIGLIYLMVFIFDWYIIVDHFLFSAYCFILGTLLLNSVKKYRAILFPVTD